MSMPFVPAFAIALGLLALPVAAAAQQRIEGARLATWSAQPALPIRATLLPPTAPFPHYRAEQGTSLDAAMMIVGGTALMVGLSMDGDGGRMLSISGAVIGLIGLYRYMR